MLRLGFRATPQRPPPIQKREIFTHAVIHHLHAIQPWVFHARPHHVAEMVQNLDQEGAGGGGGKMCVIHEFSRE
jgi:hypothetical protein